MGERKATVLICDLCGGEQIDSNFEAMGIRIERGMVVASNAGGSLPPKVFVCWGCVESEPVLMKLAQLPWKE